MDSSTWPRGSSKPAVIAGLLVALVVLAPAVWLTMIETGYVLAYQSCAERSNWWIHKPNLIFLAITMGAAAAAWWLYRRYRTALAPIGFLAGMALLVSGLIAIVAIATAIPPLILHPCD
jgi:hypothetical protein